MAQKLEDILHELKTQYREKWPHKIELLHKLFHEKNWTGLKEEFHKLKGNGKTYGFPEITVICQHLEDHLNAKPLKVNLQLITDTIALLTEISLSPQAGENFPLEKNSLYQKILKELHR